MNLTAHCPGCGALFTIEDARAKVVADARAKVVALEADEADAAKEIDRVRSEATIARASLAKLLSLTAATKATP